MIESKYRITEEKKEIWKQRLISKVGYAKAHDLHNAAVENYNPIEYAVQKTKEQLEIR